MKTQGALMLIVRLKTSLTYDELIRIAKEREPDFKAISGILQKYYIRLGENEYGGVYIWDSKESLETYKKSELAASIPIAYQVTEPPKIELVEILFNLRD